MLLKDSLYIDMGYFFLFNIGLLLLTDAQSKKNLEIPERAINLIEEALYSEEEPRLGGYFFTNLGHALYKTKQRARAQKLFKVCNIHS